MNEASALMPAVLGHAHGLLHLGEVRALLHEVEHLLVPALDAEADRLAAGLGHDADDLGRDRVDPRERVPADAGLAIDELSAHREEVLAVEREEVVLDRDLGEAECGEPLDLVDAERRVPVADAAPGPGRRRAEDALVGAAAARDHARVAVEGQVARERHQVPRGVGQRVEVVLEGPRRVAADLPGVGVARGEPAHVAEVHAALEGAEELHHRVLALADRDVVEGLVEAPKRALDLERDVGPAHDDRHRRVDGAHRARDVLGDVVVQRDRRDAHDLRAQPRHAALDLLGGRAREQEVEDLDLVALRAERRGDVGEGHEEAGELLERVGGVDQEDAHEGSARGPRRRAPRASRPGRGGASVPRLGGGAPSCLSPPRG